MEESINYTDELEDIYDSIEIQNGYIAEIKALEESKLEYLQMQNSLMLFIIFILLFIAFKEKVTRWIR
ncbi:hypothetical protein R9X47_21740 [Wukongibacter baidiensis]|uniref:hypothetical protein n=1 Tax=Wukongibacter baidiensis TaxID=1723361 RepID=UPI003D7F7DA5